MLHVFLGGSDLGLVRRCGGNLDNDDGTPVNLPGTPDPNAVAAELPALTLTVTDTVTAATAPTGPAVLGPVSAIVLPNVRVGGSDTHALTIANSAASGSADLDVTATASWADRSPAGMRATDILGMLPVPATAAVLFIVIASVVPQLGPALTAVFRVAPLYIVFAAIAPLLGWTIARVSRLDAPAGRAVAFSGATRNSLVVLPLALAVPGAIPLLPAVIVAQTLVELIASLAYIRVIPRLGATGDRT